ncbi:MAG: 4-hydroxy-tetrahydrodipicolinate synthase [Chitinophagaceae bacterium]
MSLQTILKGTGVAIVTPFKSNFDVDLEALGNIIDHVIKGGIDYVVTLGTTGETPTLSKEEKISIIRFTYEKIAARVPVVVGIGGNDTKELIKDIETFPLEKSVAVLSASPYYNKPSQEGIFQHYKMLAEASPKPILLYNVPGRTGRNINASTAIRLANEIKNIAGIKEASGDMAQCIQILRDKPDDFLVVGGDDALILPQIACGMQGVISVAANAFPKKFSDMIRYCLNQDFIAGKKLNDELLEAYDLMFAENNPAGVKAFLTEMGLLNNYLRMPMIPLSEELHSKVKLYLQK